MMSHEEKLLFLLNTFPAEISQINSSTKAAFGKMDLQQMTEHFSDSVREANGKTKRELVTPPDKLEAFRSFVLSERDFKPGTKNVLMGEEPRSIRNENITKAIAELKSELNDFVNFYKEDPDKKIMNPFFGPLDFKEWTQLLHKHAIHHLRQFKY